MAVLVLSGASVMAATIANHDDKEHNLTIIEGEAKAVQVLKPMQVLEKVCPRGCIVRLDGDEEDEYELEATDMVSIEEGNMYYDTPTGSGSEPAKPPA